MADFFFFMKFVTNLFSHDEEFLLFFYSNFLIKLFVEVFESSLHLLDIILNCFIHQNISNICVIELNCV